MNEKKRVLVVGLDGATFEIIRPMVKAGKLPNFARLIREGSFGPLESSMPPITPAAWTSFATGKDPSKHGLYDFQLHEGDPEKKKQVNSTFVKAKALWKILTEAGKRSIVIDVPLTYPPEEINGVLISRVMAPDKKNCAYPKALYQKLIRDGFIEKSEENMAKKHGADKANKEEEKKPRKVSVKRRQMSKLKQIEKTFRHMLKAIDKNVELASSLMKKEDWDFFMVVFMEADHAGHGFWRYQAKVRRIYEKLDEAVGKLFELAGPDTIKFIMSDHGFTFIPYSFNINEWLYEKGLLAVKLEVPKKDSMKELKSFVKNIGNKSGAVFIKGLNKKLKPFSRNAPDDSALRILPKFRYAIATDYTRSKAYLQSGTSYGVRINLEGRDKTGIIRKGEYNSFRDALIRDLRKVKHPMTGGPVFSKIFKKEEVYSESPLGTDPSPDIFMLTPEMKIMMEGQFSQKRTMRTKMFRKMSPGYGFHHTHGIFFASGREIKDSPELSPKITDLAPTILHILGVPVPEDMDGRILKEIFAPGSGYTSRKVQYQGSSMIEKDKAASYSKKDETKIKKRLEALGYIE